MKLLLIQPPIQDFYETDIRLQPIGLCYLKSAVQKYLPQVEVLIRDYHGGYPRRSIPLPAPLRYLQEYYPVQDKSPFSTFYQYYHFGQNFDAIEAEIIALKPDAVGISALFTPYYREALEIAQRIKKRVQIPIIMGGSHVSAVPQSILKHTAVDYVITGEGEKPLVMWLKYLMDEIKLDEVPNLGYKQQGQLLFNASTDNYPIDELPLPTLEDFSLTRYQFQGRALAFMITSRSCPHKCSFCSVHTTFGHNYRRRTIANVLEEIELRYQQGYRVIDFEDDNLTYYKNDFKHLCRELIQRFPLKDLQLVAMNGISYISLDDELLDLMRQAGFTHLNLALVSSDKTVRESTKRPHTIKAYLNVVDKAFALRFQITSYQILGLPNESLASMVQTLVFNAQLPVLLGASLFYLTPNSPIARTHIFTEDDFLKSRLTAMAFETMHFKREDLYTLFITTRIINFLKGFELEKSTPLAELFELPGYDPRTQWGLQLLSLLNKTGTLHFWTKRGALPNSKFDVALFYHVMAQLPEIACLNGSMILCGAYWKKAVFSPMDSLYSNPAL